MPAKRRAPSLQDAYPAHALVIPPALGASAILLYLGLSQPILYAQQMIFWKSSYSIWAGIVELWKQNDLLLATVVFFFSMVFPVIKVGALAVLWFGRLPEDSRASLLHVLGLLGKWSMLDVFVVSILIVLVKLGPMARVEPRAGVYFFSAAILLSMVTTMYVDFLARRVAAARPPRGRPAGPVLTG